VVVGLGPDGLSRIDSDERVPVAAQLPDFRVTVLWELQTPVRDPANGGPAVTTPVSFVGAPGSIRAVSAVLSASTTFEHSPEQLAAEANSQLPGLIESMSEEKGVGMHQTPTIDVWYIVRGRALLVTETDRRVLNAGDWFVQQGTWHRWENMLDEPCEARGFMIATV
jgi:mannose-6-phosphate isomerase-like protein (cupin superfamily)